MMKYFLFLLMIALANNACSQKNNGGDSMFVKEFQDFVQDKIGKEYKHFKHKSIGRNEEYSHKKLIGKITLINFWFEACQPCIEELEELNKLFKYYKQNKKFQFISFTTDPVKNARAALKKYNIKFPVISISEKEAFRLNYQSGFPTNFIIDEQGFIYKMTIGRTDFDKIRMEIANCL